MNANELSLRLQVVANYVPKKARLADIGSDHAYLPVALVRNERIQYAIAGEVVQGPYEAARKQVSKNGLEQFIEIRLGDGMEVVFLEDNIEAVTICGMGGVLIRDILERGKRMHRFSGKERLILQPNVGEKQLREWLAAEGYTIIAETILEDHHKIYEVMVAEKLDSTASYTQHELLFGPHLLQERSTVFLKKWQHQLGKLEKVRANLAKSDQQLEDKIIQVEREIQWIKEALDESK
ncbi:tRNA (adenine(22)-N(1))-methyltransferase [Candidatus Enterococcus ferrettii]|uniref:tRNA (Adenine22-N1)-methyltransferase n=1 Tax=Candidatus Enterococcus ferrettii TaxID=2815324 RepID=A0ABV0EQC5_9ENTE|nr:tRNA (adenine(22)-N(1))-methyltransferase TrmK [Enterococcus sp. 665A]MBO1340969.1 tRNA (adenine-N(1))-methyltransferase [Enterococcus sp. 665A]